MLAATHTKRCKSSFVTERVEESRLFATGSLARLQATTIVTNIRAGRGKKHRRFSWIESWTDDIDEERQLSKGMSLTLAEWFHEGIMMDVA